MTLKGRLGNIPPTFKSIFTSRGFIEFLMFMAVLGFAFRYWPQFSGEYIIPNITVAKTLPLIGGLIIAMDELSFTGIGAAMLTFISAIFGLVVGWFKWAHQYKVVETVKQSPGEVEPVLEQVEEVKQEVVEAKETVAKEVEAKKREVVDLEKQITDLKKTIEEKSEG